MSGRNVYGYTFSSNGWPMVDEGSCTWVTVPGTNVSLEIQNGQPLAILRAFAADFNAYVEPLRDADSACWTATNSVASSNHLSGTAMDLNWESHPFQVADAGFDQGKCDTIDALLDFYEGTVFWGNDWTDPKDAMHFQLGSLANGGDIDTYGNPHTADFIARKIRADGYSTFRRGNSPEIPDSSAVDLLAQAMSPTVVDRARLAALLPGVVRSWQLCNANTVERRAMWCAQVGTESGGLRWQTELADGSEYNGRADLGNTQPGDGPRYKGRDFIQITGRSNYANLSAWAFSIGQVPSRTFFVDNPEALATDQYAFLGVTWYWTVARSMNTYADNRDIVGGTRAVNGGTHGLGDRTARWNNCLAMGDRLMAITTEPTDPMEELLMMELESTSPFATPGEPKIPADVMLRNADAAGHRALVLDDAADGNTDAIFRFVRAARGQDSKYTDADSVNRWRRELNRFIRRTAVDAATGEPTATGILQHLQDKYPDVLQDFINTRKGA